MKFSLLLIPLSLIGCMPKMTVHNQCQDLLIRAQRNRECSWLFDEYLQLKCDAK